MGRATIEAVLLMSAEAVAGPKQQGKKAGRDIAYHGSQTGRVALKERQLRVQKPRLRKKSPPPGEVEIPVYEAMRRDGRLADWILDIRERPVDSTSWRRRPSDSDRSKCPNKCAERSGLPRPGFARVAAALGHSG